MNGTGLPERGTPTDSTLEPSSVMGQPKPMASGPAPTAISSPGVLGGEFRPTLDPDAPRQAFPVNPYRVQLEQYRSQLAATLRIQTSDTVPGTNIRVNQINEIQDSGDYVEMKGVGLTSFSALLKEPERFNEERTTNLQRNLVAAGYVSAESLDVPGWYDHTTRTAYSYLLAEATEKGMDPGELLRMRILMRQGKSREEAQKLIAEGSLTDQEHIESLRGAYKNTWKKPPPPGYVEKYAAEMNPDEFESYERNKETWQDSEVALSEQANHEVALDLFYREGGK